MKNICLNWTISILTGLFTLFFLTVAGFIFKFSINPFYLICSTIIFVVTLSFLNFKTGKTSIKSFWAQIIVLFDLILLLGILCYFIPDFSYDGTTYHQAMIILLKSGLNPIWDNVANFANRQEYVFTASIEYVETFLKFFEIIGANIYFVFEKIELTKITNYLFMICAFCYSFYTLKNYECSNLKSSVFSFLIIYNPICICQMLTNYVDGAFYYIFLILLFSCINYAKNIDTNKSLYLICISSVILSNLKLTGLFTTAIILIIFICLYYSKKLLLSCILASILILMSGINPYFTNIKQGRNAFYPVIKSSILEANKDGMITSYPQGFESMNRFEKFLFSTFAVSKNLSPLIQSDDVPRLKIPFTISGDDKFIFEDMRLAGFGYFFSGILLCSLILSLFIRFENKEEKKLFWTIITILLISILGNHEAWWARFVPQLWLLPLIILLNLRKEKFPWVVLISVICFLNSFIINLQYFDYEIQRTIIENKENANYPKTLYIPAYYPEINHKFQTKPIKLAEKGIKVIYVNH
ncbi:hypothetical protein IKE67_00360 [bacterium]|nr:hypothetical protein [bacterium]